MALSGVVLDARVATVMRRAVLVSLLLAGCDASGTTTPVDGVPAAEQYARVDLVAKQEFPAAVDLNGKRVCGENAKPCPSTIFGGGSSVLSLNVGEGRQVFVLYELRQTSGSNFEEVRGDTFTVEINEPGAMRCDVDTGQCEAVSTATASAPVAPEATAASPAPAGQCRLNSDCAPGEDCRFGRCGPICVEDRDCEAGEACSAGPEGFAVCTAPVSVNTAGADPV